MNICLSERVIILQVGIQLRPRKLFSRRTPTNKLPVSYKYPQTFVRDNHWVTEPQENSCLQTNQISRMDFQKDPTFSHQNMLLSLPIPTYNIFLKLLSKYFQFKFRKFCLSFINKFLNFEIGNTHQISIQSSNHSSIQIIKIYTNFTWYLRFPKIS